MSKRKIVLFKLIIPLCLYALFIGMFYLIRLTNSNGAVYRAMISYARDFQNGIFKFPNRLLLVFIVSFIIIGDFIILIKRKDLLLVYRIFMLGLVIYMLINYKTANEDVTYFIKVSFALVITVLDSLIYSIFIFKNNGKRK